MKSILIIDDDIHIGNILNEALVKEGFRISRAYSGKEALLSLAVSTPDLILLDLMLPELSGEALFPLIHDIPVIVVSAKVSIDSKVELLTKGAFDYITKPFELKELIARVNVALRNAPQKDTNIISVGELSLDTLSHTAFVGDTQVHLTRTEYAILKLLMRNPHRVIAKSVILERIMEDTPDCTESSLKQHISNLRKKLRDVGGQDYIEAVWGIGFKLSDSEKADLD